MRGILPALAVTLLVWTGIASGGIALTSHFFPDFLPNANHQLHEVMAEARRIVQARVF